MKKSLVVALLLSTMICETLAAQMIDYSVNIRRGMRAAGCRNMSDESFTETAIQLQAYSRAYRGRTRVLYVGNVRLGYARGIVQQVERGLALGDQVLVVFCTNASLKGCQGPDPGQLLLNQGLVGVIISNNIDDVVICRMRVMSFGI